METVVGSASFYFHDTKKNIILQSNMGSIIIRNLYTYLFYLNRCLSAVRWIGGRKTPTLEG